MDKSEEENQIQELVTQYAKKQKLYAGFSLAIKNLMLQLLSEKGIKYQHISFREKELSKLPEKIKRKSKDGKLYKKLEDIQDLAGVRIVFYLESDKQKFLAALREEFGNLIREGEEKYKKGGYNATHFILQLDKSRTKLTEYKNFKNLQCELQLTSSLYHAWSEVEHDITYKAVDGSIERLEELGLTDIRASFGKVMEDHIQVATSQLDALKNKYESIVAADGVLNNDFIADIQKSKSNDEIYNNLEVVEDYFAQKPEEILSIIKTILSKRPLPEKVVHEFFGRKIYGKSHSELVLKCLEVIQNQRMWYSKFNEILGLVVALVLSEDKTISSKAKEVLKKIAAYDYVLMTKTKVSYSFQRMALDYISAWSTDDKKKNISSVEIIAEEILSSDVRGMSSDKMDTLTLHTGAVSPTDFLKKMRREAVDLIVNVIENTDDINQQIKLTRILSNTSRPPSHVATDEVIAMIKEDNKYLAKIYRKIIFKSKGEIKNLAIASTVETQLGWINKSDKLKTTETQKLEKDILENEKYKTFGLLVGRQPYLAEEIDLFKKETDNIFTQINKKNLKRWIVDLEDIASQRLFIEEWQFSNFKNLLHRLAVHKPEIIEKILDDNFKNNGNLKYFLSSILDGYRAGGNLKLWDLNLKRIINKKDISLVPAIAFSLNLPPEADIATSIRDEDLETIKKIVNQDKEFKFLKGKIDRVLHYAVINTLTRNYNRDKKFIESLIIKEFKKHPENTGLYIHELSSAVFRKWITFNGWSSVNLNLLIENLIKSPDMSWEIQQLVLKLSEAQPDIVFEIFKERIKLGKKKKEKDNDDMADRYETIPYHFNPELQKYISEHPKYVAIMTSWIKNMTWEWSIYNWDVSHFIERTGGNSTQILNNLIKNGDENSLMKAARIVHDTENSDIALCLEIVRKTNNKRIIGQIDAALRATGVVTGHYGIAEAYENKAKELEPYLQDKNKRVKGFVKTMIKSFQLSAIAERKRVDEETGRRKIDFEGI